MTEEDKRQLKAFYNALIHDNRDSVYFICNKTGKKMHSRYVTAETILPELFSERDCYFSINGFSTSRRRAENCRQINALVFDLDNHDADNTSDLHWLIMHNHQLIIDAVNFGDFPAPNFINYTGRGLQLFYILERSVSCKKSDGSENTALLYYVDLARENLKGKISAVLNDEYSLTLDNSVSHKSVIVRMPGTFNTKAGRYCETLYSNDDYYEISELLPGKKTEKKKLSRTMTNSVGLQLLRIGELEKLQEYRNYNCEGHRYLMSLVYFNSAVQVYGKERAEEMLHDFCGRFSKSKNPFYPHEEKQIVRSITKSGHLKLSKEWVVSNIGISEAEQEYIGMNRQRSMSKVLKSYGNKLQKEERDRLILKLAREKVLHSEIAKTANCSLRTVQNVLKKSGFSRPYNVQK